MYFRAVKQDFDYTKEVIDKIGKDEYWDMNEEERQKKKKEL